MSKKRRKTRARLVPVDPALPVSPSNALPGSNEKIEELARRFAAGQLLHVEGDLLAAEGLALRVRCARNGTKVDTGEVVLQETPDGEKIDTDKIGGIKSVLRSETLFSTNHRDPMGSLRYGASLGDRVRRYRLDRKFTLGQLALAAGIGKGHLWNIESGGRVNPSFYTVWALADALKVSLDELVGRKWG